METKNEPETTLMPVEEWADDIASRKPRPHIIQDLLPAKRGEYIAIAGRTGIGKTNLALHLGFCLATGTPFFGLDCQKRKVAFLEFEGDERNIKDRYDKLKGNFPPTEGRLLFGMEPISNPKSMLRNVLNKAEGCAVIIIDPIKYLVSGDYLKPSHAAQFVAEFKEKLALSGLKAIITLPIRKPNENSLIHPGDVYSMKGATEYADSATSVLLLEKRSYIRSISDDKFDNVTLYFAKHRIASKELSPINLKFSREKCIFMVQED